MIRFNTDDIFLVTGASSGIGRGIAMRLNELGASVIAVGRSVERLNQLKDDVQTADNLYVEPYDLVENISELPKWVKSLSGKYGKLRGLVYSAGVMQMTPLKAIDEKVSKDLFDINYFCPIFLAKGFADKRVNSGSNSSILFIASIAGVRGSKAQTIYAGSKGALISSAIVLSKELAPNTRVNCISSHLVNTSMYQSGMALGESELTEVPPSMLGTPSDISAMAAFLASDEARWITGQNYIMDGGIVW